MTIPKVTKELLIFFASSRRVPMDRIRGEGGREGGMKE